MHRIRRPIHYLIPTIMTSYEGRWIMNDRPTTCFPYNGKWMHNARIDSGNYVSANRRNAGKRKQVCLLFKNFRKPSRFRTNEISGYIETFTRLHCTSYDETIGRFRLLIPATKFLSVISMEGYSLYIAYFLAPLKKQGFFPGMKNYFFGTAWKRDGFTLVIKNNNDIRGE